MKKLIARLIMPWAVLATLIVVLSAFKPAQENHDWKSMKGDLNLFIANDLGRNGYYDQKPIAALMGEMAEDIGPEAVLALGDVHHFEGIKSTFDPLWLTNYEHIYSHPELMIAWYPILGNHEYRGNTQAVLDYSAVSRRWEMPARYYSKTFEHKGTSVKVVFIDTTPLIDKYRNDSITYPDAHLQDMESQLTWLDRQLADASEDWVIVAGHHPIYADTPKAESERSDMQNRVGRILQRHNVDMYICGHIHNFQHIKPSGSAIDYIVNTSASQSRRKVKSIEGSQFVSGDSGFSILTANKDTLSLNFIDKSGNAIHTVSRTKLLGR